MRPYRILALYVAGVLIGGAFLAPWIYWAAQGLASLTPLAAPLARHPFHRYEHRALLLLAVVGLWPFLRAFGVRSWPDLGLSAQPGRGGRLLGGIALSMGALALAAVFVLLAGARVLDTDVAPAALGRALGRAALTASVVAILEEVLFRGGLFGGLRRGDDWRHALVVSSALYAVLHFFGRPESPDTVTWWSGLALLPGMLGGFADVQRLVPDFLNIFAVGIVLALAYQRTGDLYTSIGMHAGWIFGAAAYGALTVRAQGVPLDYWGSGILVDGWMALLVLSLTLVALLVWMPAAVPEEAHAGVEEPAP
jgi:membrane protease YdiL (CAAX protease family)